MIRVIKIDDDTTRIVINGDDCNNVKVIADDNTRVIVRTKKVIDTNIRLIIE